MTYTQHTDGTNRTDTLLAALNEFDAITTTDTPVIHDTFAQGVKAWAATLPVGLVALLILL